MQVKVWVYPYKSGNVGQIGTHLFVEGSANASLGVWEQFCKTQ